jgi:hypothetical protein
MAEKAWEELQLGTEDWKSYWQTVADTFSAQLQAHEDLYGKAITEKEYDVIMGQDKTRILLVEYTGGNSSTTQRRGDARREHAYYTFGSGSGPVEIAYPPDKFSYIRKALSNPDTWKLGWKKSPVVEIGTVGKKKPK